MKTRIKIIVLLSLLGCLALLPHLLAGSSVGGLEVVPTRNADRVKKIKSDQLDQLRNYVALQPESLTEVASAVEPARIEARTKAILKLDSLCVGARDVDTDGEAAIHRYLRTELKALKSGNVSLLGTLKGTAVVPVPVDKLRTTTPEAPSQVTVGGQAFRVSPLWPNGAMPSLCPVGGLTGPLVYVERGEWNDLKGLDLSGAIAVMDFGGARNFERLFSLGAAAIVVAEDDQVLRENAEGLFFNTPSPCPRFYIDAQGAAALKAHAARRDPRTGRLVAGKSGTLTGGSRYEPRPLTSLFAYLPPNEEVRIEVKADTLLKRIAGQFNAKEADIRAYNKLTDPIDLKPGQKLIIPGQDKPYPVTKTDLVDRIGNDYGVKGEEILKASKLKAEEVAAGVTLVVPNMQESVVLTVPIDTVSVAPDAPHGARTAANISAALAMLEHLATAPHINRRKGIVVAFLDGECVGGLSSRMLAEHLLMQAEGGLVAYNTDDIDARIRRYEAAQAWFTDPSKTLSRDDAFWFAQGWVNGRLEDARIRMAEERIGQKSIANAPLPKDVQDPRYAAAVAAKQAAEVRKADLEARIAWVSGGLRDKSVGNSVEPDQVRRLAELRRLLTEAEAAKTFSPMPVTLDGLQTRLKAELAQVSEQQTQRSNNNATARKVWETLHPGQWDKKTGPKFGKHAVLGYFLDLSSGSHSMGMRTTSTVDQGDFPAAAPMDGKGVKEYADRFANVSCFAADRIGWSEQTSFLTDDDRLDIPTLPSPRPATYSEFWQGVDVGLLPLGTLNDRFETLDTPHDTINRLDFANLSIQARTALVLLKLGLESPADSAAPKKLKRPEFGRTTGRALRFNMRQSTDPQDPVADVGMYSPGLVTAEPKPSNTATYRGVRRGIMRMSLLNGAYTLPLEVVGGKGKPVVLAYRLDRETALFDRVADQGQIGTQKKSASAEMIGGREINKNITMTSVYPWVFFSEPDPVDYVEMGSTRDGQLIKVVDAISSGEPQHFARVNPTQDYGEADVLTNIIFMEPGRRVRLSAQKGMVYKYLLTGDLGDDPKAKGNGFLVGPSPDGGRNLTLPLTTFIMAEEMLQLTQRRHDIYERYGITDRSVQIALDRAKVKLEMARKAKETRDWQASVGASREAWGILIKVYPRIMTLGREAVFSVVLLMALLVPACIFLERLVISAKGIIAQLVGATLIFSGGVLFLNFFHPAFKIAVSPFIVMIAFTMILMSLIVLALSYQRFDVLVRRARAAAGEVEGEEISLASSLGTALSLGVSNLKKRPARTFLTTLTVSVLTFSIITFVSVKGQDAILKRAVSIDMDLNGAPLDAAKVEKPRYTGVLFRNFYWTTLPETFVSALYSEFGARTAANADGATRKPYTLTTRGFYIQTEGGNNMDREGQNQIEVRKVGDKGSFILTGIMGFMPNEPEFSGLNEAVSHKTWFRAADLDAGRRADRFTVILPQEAADALKITKADLVDAEGKRKPDDQLPAVSMQSIEWRVIGILDTHAADHMRDANGKSLAMVDWRRSGFAKSAGEGDLVNEQTSYHKSWREFAIVPMEARKDVNMGLRSVAVKFATPADDAEFFDDAKMRLSRAAFYADASGTVQLVTTNKAMSLAGLAKVIVPVVLCILIVLNTMLGAVDERKGEVAMLGAIGLSPWQIAFLLLSESAVFSVLGIVFGVFSGLGFGWISAHTQGLSGLSVNFTALSAIGLAMLTGVVVLLATLIPARNAAKLAAPSGMERWELPQPSADKCIRFQLPFTLTRGNAVGMMAFFRRFLLNHTEATSEDFNCRHTAVRVDEDGTPSLSVTTDMWLAPYDLDVAQHLHMRVFPTENAGVFAVEIVLARTSGTEDAWMRTNYGFMNLVRHQFLLWRNLDNQSRLQYIAEGATLFQEAGK